MTCAQGLLRLLWGGPEVGVLRDWTERRVLSTAVIFMLAGVNYLPPFLIFPWQRMKL